VGSVLPSNEDLSLLMRECNDVFRLCARKLRILDSLAWTGEVAEEFFKRKESQLPKPQYAIDRKALEESVEVLKKLSPKLKGDHPVLR